MQDQQDLDIQQNVQDQNLIEAPNVENIIIEEKPLQKISNSQIKINQEIESQNNNPDDNQSSTARDVEENDQMVIEDQKQNPEKIKNTSVIYKIKQFCSKNKSEKEKSDPQSESECETDGDFNDLDNLDIEQQVQTTTISPSFINNENPIIK